MNQKIQKEYNRLCNLKQYRDKPDAEKQKLLIVAQLNVAKKQLKIDDRFSDEKEKNTATDFFEHYIANYNFEKFTDLCTLQSLIYEEILLQRIHRHINITFQKNKDTYLDRRERETLTETEKRIEELKIKLGIDSEDVEKDELTAHQLVEQRFEKHINANREEFTFVCSSCGTIRLLRRRVKDFDNIKHPWFAGRWFFNYQIMLDVKEEKITKEQAWRYLCSASKGESEKPAFSKKYCIDYISYCLENWDEITENLK